MPKKIVKVEGERLLKNIGDGALICDIPGEGVSVVNPGGTIRLSADVADFYLAAGNNGNWKDAKEEAGE